MKLPEVMSLSLSEGTLLIILRLNFLCHINAYVSVYKAVCTLFQGMFPGRVAV